MQGSCWIIRQISDSNDYLLFYISFDHLILFDTYIQITMSFWDKEHRSRSWSNLLPENSLIFRDKIISHISNSITISETLSSWMIFFQIQETQYIIATTMTSNFKEIDQIYRSKLNENESHRFLHRISSNDYF